MNAGAPRKLGRIVEHDPRSRAFGIVRAPRPLISRDWSRAAPAFDQGEIGSCTGQALIGVCVTHPFRGTMLGARDGEALYSAATRRDRVRGCWPPDDVGSSGLAVCKAASKLGLIAGYRHAFGLGDVLEALARIGPLIAGFTWYEGFDRPVGTAARLGIAGAARGGHEVELLAIDVRERTVTGVNSWGPEWGCRGRFSLTWDTLGELLADQGDATIPLAT